MRTVKDILVTKGDNVVTIDHKQSVYDAILLMDTHHIGSLVVTDNGELVGVISERDYACKVIIRGKQSKTTNVDEIMSGKVVVARPETTINECMALMTGKHIRHLPVLDDGKLVGLISIGDVVKEVIDEQSFVIEQLESYIHS
jgi:CBS domain-containing protein